MEFAGKTAISTGAASGMGLLFSQNFAELGGNVVMCDVNEEALDKCVREINEKGGRLESFATGATTAGYAIRVI